jgi:hypothetical protein
VRAAELRLEAAELVAAEREKRVVMAGRVLLMCPTRPGGRRSRRGISTGGGSGSASLTRIAPVAAHEVLGFPGADLNLKTRS